jgi:dTDP-4-dehydrorhamnose 3,5-epimerase-like enzyme
MAVINPTSPLLIQANNFKDHRGDLAVVEFFPEINFHTKRLFHFSGENHVQRGGHAHLKCSQILICVNGQINIEITSKIGVQLFFLEKGGSTLYLPPLCWVEVKFTSHFATLVVLADELFDEEDYIRNRQNFDSVLENSSTNNVD